MTVSLIMFGLIGILIGILSSMFGFGGGFVVVPVLYAFLPDTIPHEYLMHTAIGSSLAVMIINSFNSTYNHSRKGNIKWSVFKKLAGFIAAGSLIGGIVAIFIDSEVLRILFIALLGYILISNLLKKTFTSDREDDDFQLPGKKASAFFGTGIGFISTLLGIGGSVMTIPFLRKQGMRMLNAVALATPLGLPIAIVGAFSYLVSGLQVDHMPASTIGFIYLPALVGFTVGGFIGVPFGRKWAQKLPDGVFSKAYLAILAVVIIMMIVA
ncbi:sulfite exporter TauE/SafE family protein [Rossellomorea marisflavi]|uniref:sulfite exporter TauE/SafE family protein n=1 Tax=Rossellomorea marisflavi TaxID=189381 RepID=UPI00064FB6D2|nr:sulfite exporter TauE/SafE family protein [Rossellomorea marisflavi]KMK95709.1 hypothetical protein VL03_05820 [Rossellomorea marisflavi]